MKTEIVIAETLNNSLDSNVHLLMLKEKCGDRRVMLVIGTVEAQGIASACEDIMVERPLTHDLFAPITEAFGIKLVHMVVDRVVDGTFYSSLCYKRDGEIHNIDARTSDAVAIALRAKVPMFIEDELLSRYDVVAMGDKIISFSLDKADEKTLRAAIDIAVKQEKYELAMEFKEKLMLLQKGKKN